MHITPKRVLPIIVLSQFLCTTLWFGGNAVLNDLVNQLNFNTSSLGAITISVQLGFIIGTLFFAILTLADRFKPSSVFFLSAIAASLSNFLIIFAHHLPEIVLLRFCTGFFLAGIYPVGMKIAADYFDKGLGKALGYLVGALVIGTAFPHLLKGIAVDLSWKQVLISISILSIMGGSLMWLFVSEGPFRKPMAKLDLNVAIKVFKPGNFRSAAFGYFGHMWELYTFWAFTPLLISNYTKAQNVSVNISLLAFSVIGIGAIGCIASGYIAERIGAKRTAFVALSASGCCCIVSPFAFHLPLVVFISFLLFWGWMVVADSPMFSTLVASNAIPEYKGTALTIVTSIGFLITVVSIQLLNSLSQHISSTQLYLILASGPILGLIALLRNNNSLDNQ